MERIQLTLDEFGLIAASLNREFVKTNGANFSYSAESIFLNVGVCTHIFVCEKDWSQIWMTFGSGGSKFEIRRPSGFFKKDEKVRYDAAVELLKRVHTSLVNALTSDREKLICDHIPAAKDIIAEKKLVEES